MPTPGEIADDMARRQIDAVNATVEESLRAILAPYVARAVPADGLTWQQPPAFLALAYAWRPTMNGWSLRIEGGQIAIVECDRASFETRLRESRLHLDDKYPGIDVQCIIMREDGAWTAPESAIRDAWAGIRP